MQGQEHNLHLLLIGVARDSVDRLTSGLRDAGAMPRAANATSLADLDLLLSRPWDVAVCRATPELDLTEVLRRCEHQQLPLVLIAATLADATRHPILREQIPDDAGAHAERLVRTVLREAENTQLRRRLAQLEQRHVALERRHDLLLEQSASAYSYLQDGMHVYCNASYAALFGYDDADAVRTTPLLNLVQPADRATLRAVFAGETITCSISLQGRRRDGSVLPLSFRFTPVDYHGTPCMLLAVRDAAHSTLAQEPHHTTRDLVTGLDNHAGFERTLEVAIRAATQSGEHRTLVLVTLSDYTALAAVLGKAALRLALHDVARHLTQHASYVARVQDDEFALLRDDSDPTRALAFCRALERNFGAALSDAVPAALELGCEVGMALIDERVTTAAELLARARGQARDRDAEQATSQLDGVVLTQLREALQERQLEFFYQPFVPLRATALQGYELLPCLATADTTVDAQALRRTATLGGLSESLDRELLTRALQLRRSLPHESRFWCALSNASLHSTTFLSWLSAELETQRASTTLTVELNEIDLLRQRDKAMTFCHDLAQLGLGFAISHFGGALEPYAWLCELRDRHGLLPALLKLDAGLLHDLNSDDERSARLRSLIEDAHALAVPVAAPEVMDLNLLPLLWQLGVDYVQGSALGAPAAEFQHMDLRAQDNTTTAGSTAARKSTWH